jgi:DNA-binding NtrC family response regulator
MSLMTREWPGNVRELRNYVERSAALGWEATGEPSIPVQAPAVDLGNMPLDLPLKEARDLWVERFERTYLEKVLDQCGGNVTRAAGKAGVSRRFLQRTMARLKGG